MGKHTPTFSTRFDHQETLLDEASCLARAVASRLPRAVSPRHRPHHLLPPPRHAVEDATTLVAASQPPLPVYVVGGPAFSRWSTRANGSVASVSPLGPYGVSPGPEWDGLVQSAWWASRLRGPRHER